MNHNVILRKVEKERKQVLKEIEELKKDENVQKFLDLLELSDDLKVKKEEELYYVKLNEYKKCKHILINSNTINDYMEGRVSRDHTCIKCGISDDDYSYDSYNQDSLGRARYDYLVNYCVGGIRGTYLKYNLDSELAMAVYNKIKENYKNIDDKTLIKYFEIAIDNMRNIKVSEERKQSRIKRLNLRKNFNRW